MTKDNEKGENAQRKRRWKNDIDQGTEMAESYFGNETMKTFFCACVLFCSNIMAGTEWNKKGFQGTMIESPYVIGSTFDRQANLVTIVTV